MAYWIWTRVESKGYVCLLFVNSIHFYVFGMSRACWSEFKRSKVICEVAHPNPSSSGSRKRYLPLSKDDIELFFKAFKFNINDYTYNSECEWEAPTKIQELPHESEVNGYVDILLKIPKDPTQERHVKYEKSMEVHMELKKLEIKKKVTSMVDDHINNKGFTK